MKQSRRISLLLLLVMSLASARGVRFDYASVPVSENHSQSQYSIDNDEVNGLQNFFRVTLAATEKHFRGQLGEVNAFGAGTTYPQIWLRDSATAIPVTRYYYPLDFMTSWIEEHLSHQNRDGGLNDWIASGGRSNFLAGAPRVREVYRDASSLAGGSIAADKNTTEADQETSAVDAVYQVFRIKGDSKWLTKKVAGQPIVRRLDRSLSYLLNARFDGRHGLITNALTADWGDVSSVYDDQRAIYLDRRTPRAASLYTNVLFYRATKQMSDMYRALGQTHRSIYWLKRGERVKRNINKFMWQENKGFYRMHVQLTPGPREPFDESNLFAMGGNGLAVLYAVADNRQAARIFDVASQRQHEFGFSTIAGVLLPPYPRGFFRHPAVNEEYKYQNGGQWDWFAGRFLLAEFEFGDSRRATEQLMAIAAKAKASGGLYEWHTREGMGMGSPNYLGSAGALAAALFQGLFGVYLTADSLEVRIRLAERSARINLHEPATDQTVFYEYKYSPAEARLVLTYESNFPKLGNICVRMPNDAQPQRFLRDGKQMQFRTETVGNDRYGCFKTDWARHQVEAYVVNARPD